MVVLSHSVVSTLCNPMDYCQWDFPGKDTGKYWRGQPFSFPGEHPDPGIEPEYLHFRQILYHLSHQGSLKVCCCCSATKLSPILCDPMNWAFLSFSVSWSLLKLMSIESVMPSNHLILCRPLFSSCLQSFPASSGGQCIRVSVSTSVLPKSIQG